MRLKKKFFSITSFNIILILSTFVLPSRLLADPNSLSTNEIVIKVTNKPSEPQTLVFNHAGIQKIKIENHLNKNIIITGFIFMGDEFIKILMSKSLFIQGEQQEVTIPAKTSYTFMMRATENAVNSINAEGELLYLSYIRLDNSSENYAPLRVKINYNDQVIFKVRNLDFSKGKYNPEFNNPLNLYKQGTYTEAGATIHPGYDDLPVTQKLTIINRGQEPIIITNISTNGGKDVLFFESPELLRRLDGGEFCEVEVRVNFPYPQKSIIPIYVTYDVLSEKGTKKNLTAIAAAIINFYKYDNLQFLGAAASGTLTTIAVKGSYSGAKEIIHRLISNILGGTHSGLTKKLTDTLVGLLAGIGYNTANSLTNYISNNDYNGNSMLNKLVDNIIKRLELGTIACLKETSRSVSGSDVGIPVCLSLHVACGLLGTIGSKALIDLMVSNVVLRLPEQNTRTYLINKSKNTISFASGALIRVACKSDLVDHENVYQDITEIYQEALSSLPMLTDMGTVLFHSSSSSGLKNNTFISEYNRETIDCQCDKLYI